ncbi:putative methyl-CpG-binding domain protein 3-like 5 [Choloepus didactylus]|uniref:putative methyl-CpG-binding domain protein 3-like 5 n=1 Tax=Choloepus didactylus TaxID=27675 RepID=UPI00189F8075|nr:putative methyl-CpG-binding domain protein 3-like 5 [Choloepus didactylus]
MISQTSQRKQQCPLSLSKWKPRLSSALPVRMTSCIFLRPVTKISSNPGNVIRHRRSEENLEKPNQLYWYRRLEGLQAYGSAGEPLSTLEFPNALELIVPGGLAEPLGPAVDRNLHISPEPSPGNSVDWVDQGHHGVSDPLGRQQVTYNDVRKQARRVKKARERLAKALKPNRLAQEAEQKRGPEEKF